MNRRKTLKELTLKDNFLFCAVMAEEENCRGLLEMLLFLSTQGNNPSEVPEELVRFLHFVKADLRESQRPSGDPYVARLQRTIARMKCSREWEERIRKEQDPELLKKWLFAAARAGSVREFSEQMQAGEEKAQA